MLPSMNPKSQKRVKTRPHLVLKIHQGWRFDQSACEFVSESDERICMKKTLPATSSVVPRIPTAKASSQNEAERTLSRYFNILLSERDDLKKLADEVDKLKCTETVEFPADVSLPADSPRQSC